MNTTATAILLAFMLVLLIGGIGAGTHAIYTSKSSDVDFCYGYAICR